MIGPLSVLGIWATVRTVQVTIAWLLNSVGEAGLMGVISMVVLIPLVPGLIVAAELWGITAVAWVMLADMVFSLALLAWFAARRGGVSLGRQLAAVRPVAIACPLTWGAAFAVAELTESIAPAIALLASAAAGVAAYVGVISLVEPGLLRQARAQMARTLGRNQPAETAAAG
jgi:hypothetical protein